MNYNNILEILRGIKKDNITPEEAYDLINIERSEELKSAVLDYERPIRTGYPEVVYAKGKSITHLLEIINNIYSKKRPLIVTKLRDDQIIALEKDNKYKNVSINSDIGIALCNTVEDIDRIGSVVVVSGGTSDYVVAEESAIIAEALGSNVTRLYDVGVAGLHRILSRLDSLRKANVIIAVAGMEGALPSVVAGLVTAPVIAVPTSIGYGTSFGGVSALLSMLNSCAPGLSVVNIDNGFGGAYQANLINTLIERK